MADTETEPVTECVDDQRISRGEKPENTINLAELETSIIYDEDGNKLSFGEFYKHHKTIVILIRNFLCFMAKEYVDDLSLIPEQILQDAHVKLIVIGCGPHKFIRDFKNSTGFKCQMYTDPSRELYKKLHCKEHIQHGKKADSKHVKSSFFIGIMKSAWRGMKFREYQGDLDQQGGSFIFGPGNQVLYEHRDWSPKDHAPINEVLRAAGVEEVQFEKDNPIINI